MNIHPPPPKKRQRSDFMTQVKAGEFGSSPACLYIINAEQTGGNGNTRVVKVTVGYKVKGSSSSTYGYPLHTKIRIHNSYSDWITCRTSGEARWNGGQDYRYYSWTATIDVGTTSATNITVGLQLARSDGGSTSWNSTQIGAFSVGQTNTPPWLSGGAWTNPSGTIPENTGSISVDWNGAGDSEGNLEGYRVYRYVNGSHNHTLWPGLTKPIWDDISWCGEGTSVYYKVWAYDSSGAYSGEINSNTITKNTLTGGRFTGHSSDIYYGTEYFDLNFTGGSNTNGVAAKYHCYSDDITVHNQQTTTGNSQRIYIYKGGNVPSGPYIRFEDLKNKFRGNNYNGRLHVGLVTTNDYGTARWGSGSIGVDIRTDISVAQGSTYINDSSYYTIGGTKYLVPSRKSIVLNWPTASDPLGTAVTYRIEQSINNGGWTTLVGSTSNTNHSFGFNVSNKPSYKFRVVARNGYGYEKVISGEPSGVMYNYNPPSVSVTGATRISNKITVNINTSYSSEIPGNNIKALRWSFGSKNGNLPVVATSFEITGLEESDSGTYSITIEDNYVGTFGLSATTIYGSIPQFYPMLSLRKNGVGVNCIPTGKAKLMVSGGLIVDNVNVVKAFDEGAYRYGKNMTLNEDFFLNNFNGLSIYNNAGNDSVTISREVDITAPNASRQVLKISNTGPATPGHGGFTWAHGSHASGVWNYIFTAKLPVGKYLTYHNNAYGDGSAYEWRTSNQGTGNWETYVCTARAGKTGDFHTIGFFAVNGGENNFDWYLARATYYEATYPVKIPQIAQDGVMEVGQYIDFHENNKLNDYDARIFAYGSDNNGNGRSSLMMNVKTITAGNNVSEFKLGYNVSDGDSGITSDKNNIVLGSAGNVWLKANNFFDGANDVHYNHGVGASQILMEHNQYPKFRWSNSPGGQGIAQWGAFHTMLTSDTGQQVFIPRWVIGNGGNLNEFTSTGAYQVSTTGGGSNLPPNSYYYGILMVFTVNQCCCQMYVPHHGGHFMQYRMKYNTADWTPWANVGWSQFSLSNNEAVSVLNSDINTLDMNDKLMARDLYEAIKEIATLSNGNSIGISKESLLGLNDKVKDVLVDKTEEYTITYEPEEGELDNKNPKSEGNVIIIPSTEDIKKGVEGTWAIVALQEEIKIRDAQYAELKKELDEIKKLLGGK